MTTRLVCNVPRSYFTKYDNAQDDWCINNLANKLRLFISSRMHTVTVQVISYDEKTARMSVESERPFDTFVLERILLKGKIKPSNPSQSSLFQ